MVESVPVADLHHRLTPTKFEHVLTHKQMERAMLAKTPLALATAAILSVVSVAQAATKDKAGQGGASTSRIVQPQRYGSSRFFWDVPQAPTPDDYEGYPHPR